MCVILDFDVVEFGDMDLVLLLLEGKIIRCRDMSWEGLGLMFWVCVELECDL